MPVETMSSEVLLMLRGLREPDAPPTNIVQSTVARRAPTRGATPPSPIPVTDPPPDLRPGATPEATDQKARVARAASGQLGFNRVVLEAADALSGTARSQEMARNRRAEPVKPPPVSLKPLSTEGVDSGLKRPRKSALQTVREHIRDATKELAKPTLKPGNKAMFSSNVPTLGSSTNARHQPQAMVRSASGALELQPLLSKAPDLSPAGVGEMSTADLLESRLKPLTEVGPLARGSGGAIGESSMGHFEPLQFGGRDQLFMMGNNAAPFVTDSSMSPTDVARQALERGPATDL